MSLSVQDKPHFVIEGRHSLASQLKEIWAYRELLYFLNWQALKIRYKQTAVGVLWIVLQPILNMLILTTVFGMILRVPIGNLPYPAFFLTNLIYWSYFSNALGRGAVSLLNSSNLISKVYFPRILIPFSAVLVPIVDFALAFIALMGLLLAYGIMPSWKLVFVPILLVYAMLFAFAVTLWLAALNVKYRDVNYLLPFLLQVWMYLTPIIYPVSLVSAAWRKLYMINPMASIVEGARWVLLDTAAPPLAPMLAGGGLVVALLVGGLVYFHRAEQVFADII